MNLLQTYSECLKKGDAEKIASLFTEDAIFNDAGPTKLGQKTINLKGRKKIEALFKILLARGGFKVSNIGINNNAMRYDVEIGGTSFLALGVMKVENNLIKEYIVTVV
ncbi:MAG: nuclear transport factor 2 family protein [Candidatus Hodarchaeota archaeon]